MPATAPRQSFFHEAQTAEPVRKALAAYRAVRFSIMTGVRVYFAEKEARRADVLAAVADVRAERLIRRDLDSRKEAA
jgi:hypothetical protein